jgi:hypothetical protein
MTDYEQKLLEQVKRDIVRMEGEMDQTLEVLQSCTGQIEYVCKLDQPTMARNPSTIMEEARVTFGPEAFDNLTLMLFHLACSMIAQKRKQQLRDDLENDEPAADVSA